MEESTIREKVFKSIRNALIEKTDAPFPETDTESSVFRENAETAEVTFAQEFTKIGGKFAYCEDENDMAEKLKFIIQDSKMDNVFCFEESLKPILELNQISFEDHTGDLLESSIGITTCEFLTARTGSVIISSRQLSGRRINVFPEIHVVVASTNQLVNDVKDGLSQLKEIYEKGFPSSVTVISGPSRTADIEKTLVMGAHGPKELYVLLVEAEK